MQLPAFISRLSLFADKAEGQLDAIAKATKDADLLRDQVKVLTADAEQYRSLEAAATAQIEKLTADNAALAKQITELSSAVETEKRRASEVISAQGLPIGKIPAASTSSVSEHTGQPDLSKMNLTERCLYLNAKKAAQRN